MNSYLVVIILTFFWRLTGLANKYILDNNKTLNPLVLAFVGYIVKLIVVGYSLSSDNVNVLEIFQSSETKHTTLIILVASIVSAITLTYYLPIFKKEKFTSLIPFRDSVSIIFVVFFGWLLLGESVGKNTLLSMLFFAIASYFAYLSSLEK